MRVILACLLLISTALPAYAGCELNTAFGFESELNCPDDVKEFFIANDSCAHFSGEPYEGRPDREAFLRAEMEKLQCTKLMNKLVALVRKYESNQAVMGVLAQYDHYMFGQPYEGHYIDNPDAPAENSFLYYEDPTLGDALKRVRGGENGSPR